MALNPFSCGSGCGSCNDAGCGGCNGRQVILPGGGDGENGKSAYEIAVDNGFIGDEPAWLLSLHGADGDDGISAYEVALDNGFVGTEPQWLASLVGPKGDKGDTGDTSVTGYRFGGFAVSNILSGEILLDHEVTQNFTLPANFVGSRASVKVAPAATWVGKIYLDDAQIGTLTVNTDGSTVWAMSGGVDIDVIVGSYVTLVAPIDVDAAIVRLRFTFEGIVA